MRPELPNTERRTIEEGGFQYNGGATTQHGFQSCGRGRKAIDALASPKKFGHFPRGSRPRMGDDGALRSQIWMLLESVRMPAWVNQPTLAMLVIGVGEVVEQRSIDRRQEQYPLGAFTLGQQMLAVGKDHFRIRELRITANQPWYVQKITHDRSCFNRVTRDHLRIHHDRLAPCLLMLKLELIRQ
ncbi:hypothetical protein D3C81_510180 [compost metagenome]